MRVFLDVGAHDGQTLQEVLTHTFDRIYAFEPMPAQLASLGRFTDARLEVLPFGLSDRTGTMLVYGTNDDMEASLFAGKVDVDARVATPCEFMEASSFFAERISSDDEVIVKLNCEGSETAILNNLADTGELWKIDQVMVDFDVRKIPGMEHEEADLIDRLGSLGFSGLVLCEEVMIGATHQERIRNWLEGVGRDEYLAGQT